MSQHDVQAVINGEHCEPSTPAPTPQNEEPCEGEIVGKAHGCLDITGTVTMPCCCPRLYTRTFVIDLPPQSNPSVSGTIQATVNAWEAAGYLILAHGVMDTGPGYRVTLTVGWYA